MHAPDWLGIVGKNSGISGFLQNLLLPTSPRFLAQPEPNQHSEILWSLIVKSHLKKTEIWVPGP